MIVTPHWGPVEPLVLAADARDDRLDEVIVELGLEAVASSAVGEITARWDRPALEATVWLELEITHHSGRVSYLFDANSDVLKGIKSGNASGQEVMARVRYRAADLVRNLFGTTTRPGGDHQVRIEWPEDSPLEAFKMLQPATRAVSAFVAACSAPPLGLDHLAIHHGSDKWGGLHWYTPHYERHFAAFRDRPVRLLEIGIGGYQNPHGGGGSLAMWQRYFRRGLVYGLDIHPKPEADGPRVRALQGDQSDAAHLDELGRELGPFDIVIDDGSHLNEHVITSFNALFPHVRQGGVYVVEDLETSYWPGYGGNDRDLDAPRTSMTFLKRLADGLNHQEHRSSADRDDYLDRNVASVHFYHSLAFVEKGRNVEQAVPRWLGRAPAW